MYMFVYYLPKYKKNIIFHHIKGSQIFLNFAVRQILRFFALFYDIAYEVLIHQYNLITI